MPMLWPKDANTLIRSPVTGQFISVDGENVPITFEIQNAITAMDLLEYDPALGPDALLYVPGLSGTLGLLIDAHLQTMVGLYTDQIVTCVGKAAEGDGYEGQFQWRPGSSTAEDNTNVIQVGARSGRWHRITSAGGNPTGTGDWTGPASGNTVVGIRGVSVVAGTPATGNTLRASSAQGTTATGQVTFAAASGSISPGATMRRRGDRSGAIWTVASASAIVGGLITCQVTGLGAVANASAVDVMVLDTLTAATGGQMTFAATGGGAIPIGTRIALTSAVPGLIWTVTAATGIVGGFITVTVDGPCGLPAATSVSLSVAIANVTTTGSVVSTFGLSGIGSVLAPGITGGVDKYVAGPGYDVTGPKTHLIGKHFNGDTRPGITPNNSSFDNGPGIQRAIDKLQIGDTLRLAMGSSATGSDTFYVSTPIYIDCGPGSSKANGVEDCTIEGANTGGSAVASTILTWNGNDATYGCIFWVNSRYVRFHGLSLQQRNAANKNARALMIVDKTLDASAVYAITGLKFVNCRFYNGEAHTSGSLCDDGIAIADVVGVSANCEDFLFDTCAWQGFYRSCVKFGTLCQPYNTDFRGGSMVNFTGAWDGVGNTPTSKGLWCKSASAAFSFKNFTFSRLAVANYIENPIAAHWDMIDSEYCKRMLMTGGTTGVGNYVFTGSRMSTLGSAAACSDPDLTISAANEEYINCGSADNVVIMACGLGRGGVAERPNFKIRSNLGSVSLINSFLPSRTPIYVSNNPIAQAQHWTIGSKAPNGVSYGPLTQVFAGSANPASTLTVSGAATSVNVSLSGYECDTTFNVQLTPISFVNGGGAIPDGAFIAMHDKASNTQNQFTIVLRAAPGASNSVTYAYRIIPSP